MMNYMRFMLYALLAALGFLIYQAWIKDYPPIVVSSPVKNNALPPSQNFTPPQTSPTKTSGSAGSFTPPSTPTHTVTKPELTKHGKLINVRTDLINAKIDVSTGNVVYLNLLKYPEKLKSTVPTTLLTDKPSDLYLAQSGFLSSSTKNGLTFNSEKTNYALKDGQNNLQVVLSAKDSNGVIYQKIYTFSRDMYKVDVAFKVDNQSKAAWSGQVYTQLVRTNNPPATQQGIIHLPVYFGGAISSKETPYEKIKFADMAQSPINREIKGGWAAIVQHYFVSAWVPEANQPYQYYSAGLENNNYVLGMKSPNLTIAPGQSYTVNAKLYSGPSITSRLEKVSPNLGKTIDFGWFWFISSAIFWLMKNIHAVVMNWGLAIILVTVCIKLLFFPLSSKSYRSMAAMKKLQPRLASLKERYGDDKQKFTQEMMKLYRQEKVNPMSGCLPILIQIPVFIGLYWVLIESVQLRQAPFIFWIHDLSMKDPYFVLPVLMGLTFFFQQRLNPPPADPLQAKIMMFLPVVFTLLFLSFPAGLMLYWVANNLLSFLHQWYVLRTVNKSLK